MRIRCTRLSQWHMTEGWCIYIAQLHHFFDQLPSKEGLQTFVLPSLDVSHVHLEINPFGSTLVTLTFSSCPSRLFTLIDLREDAQYILDSYCYWSCADYVPCLLLFFCCFGIF